MQQATRLRSPVTCDDVISFWFDEIEPAQWWKVDAELDRRVARHFAVVHAQAVRGEIAHWRNTSEGRLAEILLLDQFSRNIWRNTPQAFSTDGVALVLAQEAIRDGVEAALELEQRRFVYMPFMHSESPEIHRQAVRLFGQKGLEDSLRVALRHQEIIERFGRYPHRNTILGRPSTAAELEFLKQPGSSF